MSYENENKAYINAMVADRVVDIGHSRPQKPVSILILDAETMQTTRAVTEAWKTEFGTLAKLTVTIVESDSVTFSQQKTLIEDLGLSGTVIHIYGKVEDISLLKLKIFDLVYLDFVVTLISVPFERIKRLVQYRFRSSGVLMVTIMAARLSGRDISYGKKKVGKAPRKKRRGRKPYSRYIVPESEAGDGPSKTLFIEAMHILMHQIEAVSACAGYAAEPAIACDYHGGDLLDTSADKKARRTKMVFAEFAMKRGGTYWRPPIGILTTDGNPLGRFSSSAAFDGCRTKKVFELFQHRVIKPNGETAIRRATAPCPYRKLFKKRTQYKNMTFWIPDIYV